MQVHYKRKNKQQNTQQTKNTKKVKLQQEK